MYNGSPKNGQVRRWVVPILRILSVIPNHILSNVRKTRVPLTFRQIRH